MILQDFLSCSLHSLSNCLVVPEYHKVGVGPEIIDWWGVLLCILFYFILSLLSNYLNPLGGRGPSNPPGSSTPVMLILVVNPSRCVSSSVTGSLASVSAHSH